MEQLSAITSFIARWQNSGAAERANFQSFINELCDQINVARPNPSQDNDAQH